MLERLLGITNATKAAIICLANAVLAVLVAFGVDLSDRQNAAVLALVNGVLLLWTALTFQLSRKRVG